MAELTLLEQIEYRRKLRSMRSQEEFLEELYSFVDEITGPANHVSLKAREKLLLFSEEAISRLAT